MTLKAEQLNSVEVRAILAGLGMATGLQLSGEPLVDIGLMVAFAIGGLVEIVRKHRAKRKARRNGAVETTLVPLVIFLLAGCGGTVLPDIAITEATLTGSGHITGTVGVVPWSVSVDSVCARDDSPECDLTVCVTVIGLTRCESVESVE